MKNSIEVLNNFRNLGWNWWRKSKGFFEEPLEEIMEVSTVLVESTHEKISNKFLN